MWRTAQGVMALKAWTSPPSSGRRTIAPHGADISPSLTTLAGLAFDRLMDDPADSIQRYDLTCAAPYKTLPSTVIPGWLWSGMMDDAGMQNIPIEKLAHSYIWRYLMAGLEWKILFRPRAARGLLQARTAPASRSRPTSDGVTMSNAARTLSRESGGDRGPFSDSEALQTSYSFWIALFASVEAGGICYNLTRAVSD